MTDQQRADLTAREGFGVDCTPTLDRLARGGVWFPRAYTASPLCVPARISMLTGRFPSAHGVRGNAHYSAPRYTADLVDVVRDAGYRTALIGKNHSHLTPDRVDHWSEYGHFGAVPGAAAAEDRAFDAWLRDHPGASTSATPFPVERQLPHRLVAEAIDFLDADDGRPAFCWLSIPEPHVPYQVPEPYFSLFTPDTVPPAATTADALRGRGLAWRYTWALAAVAGEADPAVVARARANYVGMLRLVDDAVQRLVEHLAATGGLADTLVVCLSDHGDFAGEYGLMRKGPGVPEVLTRIPMLISGPGVRPDPAGSDAHVSIVDVLPTLCELIGQPVPAGVQGRSLAPVLRGGPYPAEEFAVAYAEQGLGGNPLPESALPALPVPGPPWEPGEWGVAELPGLTRRPDGTVAVDTLNAVTQSGSVRMVRSGRWKLQLASTGELALFDLECDRYELNDLGARPDLESVRLDLLRELAVRMMPVGPVG